MGKKVSPVFAAIVIIIALVVGGLYFMVRYRNAEARFAAEAAMLQRRADEARASGRMGRSSRARMELRSRAGGSPPGSSERAAPGAPAKGE